MFVLERDIFQNRMGSVSLPKLVRYRVGDDPNRVEGIGGSDIKGRRVKVISSIGYSLTEVILSYMYLHFIASI